MTATATIPVEPAIASAYAAASPEVQREIQKLVEDRLQDEGKKQFDAVIREALARPADWHDDPEQRLVRHRELMEAGNRLAAEAKANGLTEEILIEILRDE
jgi:tRNA A37 N6-isopentenylltransferase MiaA